MKRKELLEFLRTRISEYYWDAVVAWSSAFKNKKFIIEPYVSILGKKGYYIRTGFYSIFVYKE